MKMLRNIGCFFFLLLILIAGAVISQKERMRGFARSHIFISMDKAKLDLAKLLEKSIQGKLRLNIYNSLPLGATLDNLKYAIFLNDQEIGTGFQAAPQTPILGMATSTLEITFTLDAAKARKALQGTNTQQALQMIGNLYDQIKKKNRDAGSSGKSLLRVVGDANFQILAGSFPIPLDRTAEFEKGF